MDPSNDDEQTRFWGDENAWVTKRPGSNFSQGQFKAPSDELGCMTPFSFGVQTVTLGSGVNMARSLFVNLFINYRPIAKSKSNFTNAGKP